MPPIAEQEAAPERVSGQAVLTPEALVSRLAGLAGGRESELVEYSKTGLHVHVDATPETLHPLAECLRDAGFNFECAHGIHRPPHLEAVYLFRPDSVSPRVRIRLVLPEGVNEAPSLVPVFRGADWYEREMWDFYGIKFSGHPGLQRILLPHSFQGHPLRKDFQGGNPVIPDEVEEHPEVDISELMHEEQGTERRDFFLNMGPQHPSTHGVLRLLVHTEGEFVLGASCQLGYSHRGQEKNAELKSYVQMLPYTDRLDYLSPLNYNLGYASLLERATGIEPTPRALDIRVIMAEMCRVSSHVVWLGTFLLDLGAVTPFLYCFEDRELILTFFEKVTGQRMTNSYIAVGGVRNDVPSDFTQDVKNLVKHMRKRLPDYQTLVMENEIFIRRTEGVGIMTQEQARHFGVTGPGLRGSGMDCDLRRDEPGPEDYSRFHWKVAVEKEGDCLARSRVRMTEMHNSLDIIEQALENLRDGPSRAKIPRNLKVPEGEYWAASEGPRGEVGWYLVSDGSAQPFRLKIRVPSFANLQVIEELLPGHRVADVVAILGSIDVIIPEIDR